MNKKAGAFESEIENKSAGVIEYIEKFQNSNLKKLNIKMKRILLILFAALMMVACGGTYSVTSGRDDAAQLSFTSESSYDVSVNIDGTTYEMETVKQKAYRQRNMKATAKNTITITTGLHKIVVTRDGKTVYDKQVFVSTGQHKVIEL